MGYHCGLCLRYTRGRGKVSSHGGGKVLGNADRPCNHAEGV